MLGSGPIATIRLPVHPLYRKQVEVVGRYGRHALRVEQPDGQLRLLPVAWTDLVPRRAALALRGDGAAMFPHDGETLTLVEQAGPPRAGRRGVRQKRGRR